MSLSVMVTHQFLELVLGGSSPLETTIGTKFTRDVNGNGEHPSVVCEDRRVFILWWRNRLAQESYTLKVEGSSPSQSTHRVMA